MRHPKPETCEIFDCITDISRGFIKESTLQLCFGKCCIEYNAARTARHPKTGQESSSAFYDKRHVKKEGKYLMILVIVGRLARKGMPIIRG
jgi:hypothetical protein